MDSGGGMDAVVSGVPCDSVSCDGGTRWRMVWWMHEWMVRWIVQWMVWIDRQVFGANYLK